jgi:hypothetical protein
VKEAKSVVERALLPTWIAFPCAFVGFVLAGYQVANADAELYEALNVEIPWIAQLQVQNATAIGALAVVSGLVLLALTRVRSERAWLLAARPLALLLAAFSGTTGVLFLFASAIAFQKMSQALVQ